jgi:hypothetical protein
MVSAGTSRQGIRVFVTGSVSSHQQDHPLRPHRDRGPDLLSVHHVLVPVPDRLAAESGEVAAGIGLGVAGAPLVGPVEDVGDEALLLLVGAVLDQRRPDPGEAHEAGTERRRLAPRHLLLQDHLLGDAAPAAADLLRPGESHPALAADLLLPGGHEGEVALALGPEVLVQEPEHLGAERLLFGGEAEIHQRPPSDATRS